MRKKIALALAVLAMPLTTTAAATSNAAVRYELRFYSDESRTQEIGGSITYCDNTTISWGDLFTSFYYTEISNDC